MDLRQAVTDNPLLAILRGVPMEQLIPMVRSIVDGGVRFFEVALNSPDALEQIALLRTTFGEEILVGAGTANTVERAANAMSAGAQFLLSPSTDEDVLCYCRQNNIPLMPGALTPTDISTCIRYGFHTIKLFPADAMPKGYLKSLKGPFDDTEYIAIGGVTGENAPTFLQEGFLGVGLASSLLPRQLVAEHDWEGCTAHITTIVSRMKTNK